MTLPVSTSPPTRRPQAQTSVYYAGKAFLATAVARWLAAEGVRIDVCTGGELEIAVRAGVAGPDILFHGNNKSEAEIARALEVGVGRFVIDSFQEIARVAALADEAGVVAQCLVRVTVGVEAHTHEFIATAHEDQKFGLGLADGMAREAVERVTPCRASNSSDCTPTSARRSSTPLASRWRRGAWSGSPVNSRPTASRSPS